MRTLHAVANIADTPNVIFRVPTHSRGHVFMRIPEMGDHKSVVEVHAGRFLACWRNASSGGHAPESHGNPSTWRYDYKFEKLEEKFSYGEKNPVPLANIGFDICARDPKFPEQGFIGHVYIEDGITRTIWLLTRDALMFPVMCSTSEAPLLQQYAGMPGGQHKTVSKLIEAIVTVKSNAIL